MAREPSYPAADAPVDGGPAQGTAGSGRSGTPERRNKLMKGAAIGIGSAAIVAALLFANRSKRDDKNRG